MKGLWIAILITNNACFDPKQFEPKAVKQEPVLLEYAKRFNDEYLGHTSSRISVGSIGLEFGQLSEPAVGTCFRSSERTWIVILPSYWDKASELDRLQLMYHELGHCALDQDHREVIAPSYRKDNRSSIMHTQMLSSEVFDTNYSGLIRELFTGERLRVLL